MSIHAAGQRPVLLEVPGSCSDTSSTPLGWKQVLFHVCSMALVYGRGVPLWSTLISSVTEMSRNPPAVVAASLTYASKSVS